MKNYARAIADALIMFAMILGATYGTLTLWHSHDISVLIQVIGTLMIYDWFGMAIDRYFARGGIVGIINRAKKFMRETKDLMETETD